MHTLYVKILLQYQLELDHYDDDDDAVMMMMVKERKKVCQQPA